MSDADNDKRLGSNKEYRAWVRQTHPEHFGNVETVFSAPNVGAKEDFAAVTKTPESVTGTKHDSGKPKISLIPTEAILEMATALTYGANKYSADNFKHGIKYRRLLDAAFRHLFAISAGQDVDSESGNSHLGHALASLAMLAHMMKNKPEFDDRFKP